MLAWAADMADFAVRAVQGLASGARRRVPYVTAVIRRRAGAWVAEVAVAVVPLQEQALQGWGQLRRDDLPVLGRRAAAVLRVLGRRAVVVLPRLAAVVLVAGLVGWLTPGPVLGVAARFSGMDGSPFRPLEQRSVVVAGDGTSLGVVHGGRNRRVVPLDAVPPLVQRLVTIAEDRRFYEHEGYDQAAIVRAARANAGSGSATQGASTITQQLVKQNLVGDDRSALRKIRELVLAVAVERETTKSELLARYLNEVYFGNGAYGIAAAAETYFGTTPEKLRPEQAALLATVIRAPSRLDPWRSPGQVRARRDALLMAAADDGALVPDKARAAASAGLGVVEAPNRPGIEDPDLIRAVEAEIAGRSELGATPAERLRRFRSGGWSVQTTIDPVAQDAAREAAAQGTASSGSSGAAVAVVEPGTGRIRALHSRRPAALRHLEVASSGRRQPGSAFKPLAAIAALEAGLDPLQPLEGTSGVTYELEPEDWEVHNFAGADRGPVDLATALRDSVNSAMAQVGAAVGPDRIADVAGRLGIDVAAALGAPPERGPALALGGARHGVTPLEMAGAYAAMANDGVYVRPTLIERIVGPGGKEILRLAPDAEAAVNPAVNARVRSMLQEAVNSGTGNRAALPGWQPFGKTGTSQDRADAWFVGAVPSLAAAVWIGDPQARTPMPSATGGTLAAPAWRDVMTSALDGRTGRAFPPGGELPPREPLILPEGRRPGSP